MTTRTETVSQPYFQRFASDWGPSLLLLMLIVGVALLFLWPWRPQAAPGGSLLARYAPLRDGDSALIIKYDASGQPMAWRSQSLSLWPPIPAIANYLGQAEKNAISEFYFPQYTTRASEDELIEQLLKDQLYQSRTRELSTEGELSNDVELYLRSQQGDFLISVGDPTTGSPLIFEPPLLLLPADLVLGQTWRTEGRISDQLEYESQGEVLTKGSFQSQLGTFEDCLQVEFHFRIRQDNETLSDETSTSWQCADVGQLEEQAVDAEGQPTNAWVKVGTIGLPASAVALPPPDLTDDEPLVLDNPSAWQLSRVKNLLASFAVGESTIPPLWIPTEPPALLAAGHEGDLIAFDASQATGRELWRFNPNGTIFSPPAFDPQQGRIYFGASDKRLYALDARGFFLWAFESGDNIATRPLILNEDEDKDEDENDLVIFGSEDRHIYALDALTGQERWRKETGGPVVSSPAFAAGVVVIGSDDGAVYGLDASTGEERWLYPTEDAVEASIVASEDVVYVASRDGNLYALSAAMGEEIWVASVGQTIRFAPALAAEQLFVVDEGGYLSAFNRQSGEELWQTVEQDYLGTPLVVGQSLLVSSQEGVVRFAFDGTRQPENWQTTEEASIRFGPSEGGDALWLADNTGALWRLGLPLFGRGLNPAWHQLNVETPFDGSQSLYSTPIEQEGKVLVVDGDGSIYRFDALTGEGEQVAEWSQESLMTTEPVLAGGLLLLPSDDMLRAVRLSDGETIWQAQGDGMTPRPVTVADETVLWLTQREGKIGSTSGTLHALDLTSGQVRWQAALNNFGYVGQAIVRNKLVFISTPPSVFDLSTGKLIWEADVEGLALGAPTLSQTGHALFVGLSDATGTHGTVVALDTTDGSIRWATELGDMNITPFESLWISDNLLIVPTFGEPGTILALDVDTGVEQWRYIPSESPRFGAITVADGLIWLTLGEAQLIALDAQTGQEVARNADYQQNVNSYSQSQRPVVIGQRVIVSLGLSLLAIEAPEN